MHTTKLLRSSLRRPPTLSLRFSRPYTSHNVPSKNSSHPRCQPGRRAYSDSSSKPLTDKLRSRSAVGVFSPKAAGLFVLAGVGLYFYFRWEKERLLEERRKEKESRSVGRAHVGGPFQMTTHEGKPFSDKDMLGKWSLVYFGFTNCPDICPEELDKMSEAVNQLDKDLGPIVQPIFISVDPARDSRPPQNHNPPLPFPLTDKDLGPIVQPIFISVDPARDSVPQMARYVADFHPRLIGLTGDYATAKATCKAYRVYFSTPPDAKPDDDYLVDHSIFFYFMDPEGKFVDAFGKATTAQEVVDRVKREVDEWKAEKGRLV